MKDFKTAIRMIKQELYILTAKQKRTSIFLFFVVLLGSAFELLGVTAILPLIEALMDLDSIREMVSGGIGRHPEDRGSEGNDLCDLNRSDFGISG